MDAERGELIDMRPWEWALHRRAGGELLLSVVCGTVAIFEVDVTLGPETTTAYEREGIGVIERLAGEVTRFAHEWARNPVAP